MNDDAIDEDDQALQKGRFYVPQVECHSRYWSNISAVKKVTKFFGFSSDVAAPLPVVKNTSKSTKKLNENLSYNSLY